MRPTTSWISGLLLATALGSGGCAGARGGLRFAHLEYPVSSSGYLYTPKDPKRPKEAAKLDVVGELYFTTHLWGIGWTLIPLSGNVDVSKKVNRQIAAAGGDGVINLSVTVDNCAINYVWPLNLLPVWPGCVAAGVQGKIVRGSRVAGGKKKEGKKP